MGHEIRRAKAGDERRVAEMLLKLVRQHVDYDPERFSNFVTVEGAAEFYKSRFDDPNSVVLIAELDDQVVGFTYLEFEKLNYEELLENAVWLHDIYVEEAHRSKGIGKQLLSASVKAARDLGAEKVLLTVASRNTAAQEMFEEIGFRSTMLEMTLNTAETLR